MLNCFSAVMTDFLIKCRQNIGANITQTPCRGIKAALIRASVWELVKKLARLSGSRQARRN